jgi:hypothetical protein
MTKATEWLSRFPETHVWSVDVSSDDSTLVVIYEYVGIEDQLMGR